MNTAGQERIGILGGTFNPVHLGHLILAQAALETHDLARVLFVPCCRPPHKDTTGLAAAEHRLAMVRAALEDSLCFEVDDLEIRRGGVSYAVDTVAALRRRQPDAELMFIIGTDTLRELHMWKQIYSILPLCRFASFGRPGYAGEALAAADLHLDPPWPARLLQDLAPGRLIEISSSDIRHRVAEGMSVRYLVPAAVEMYIAEHGLYGGRNPGGTPLA
jgi:nicotinate-nucleotide adenylyltransferase